MSYDVDFQLAGVGSLDVFLGPFGVDTLQTACLDYSPKVTGLTIASTINPESGGISTRSMAVPMFGCLLVVALTALVVG